MPVISMLPDRLVNKRSRVRMRWKWVAELVSKKKAGG